MNKTMRRMEVARRIARRKKAEDELKKMENLQLEARRAGYQEGRQGVRNLERMMAHPIAREILQTAGNALGKMVAEKAVEEGTPAAVALQCAEEVWSYMQKTGRPLEEVVKLVTYYRMETMGTVVRVDVDAMSFSSEVSDYEMQRAV